MVNTASVKLRRALLVQPGRAAWTRPPFPLRAMRATSPWRGRPAARNAWLVVNVVIRLCLQSHVLLGAMRWLVQRLACCAPLGRHAQRPCLPPMFANQAHIRLLLVPKSVQLAQLGASVQFQPRRPTHALLEHTPHAVLLLAPAAPLVTPALELGCSLPHLVLLAGSQRGVQRRAQYVKRDTFALRQGGISS